MAKQFGDRAERVTNQEMEQIYQELKGKVGNKFGGFELTLTLEEKQDHGDIDILVLLHPDQNTFNVIEELEPAEINRNGYCYSFLYNSDLGKTVHVDFLVSSDPNLHRTKKQYYAFNDLSSTIGILSKALNFKYGSEGFFKRYEDKRGNWHDIQISTDLNVGLKVLGLEPKPLWIKTYQDIVNYVSSSLLFSSELFKFALEDNEEHKRTKQHEIRVSLANLGKVPVLQDEDYFLKRSFPEHYKMVEEKKKEIEDKAYRVSRFNGTWLMEKFGMKPGKKIGMMLKLISDSFGDLLGEVEEELVEAFVRENLEEE